MLYEGADERNQGPAALRVRPVHDGVGPHTGSQLRYIEKLKRQHGIDYDSHGSYRFVEK